MEYIEWFLKSTFSLLALPVDIFGYTWRFFDADIYIMFAGVAVYFVRKLLDLPFKKGND